MNFPLLIQVTEELSFLLKGARVRQVAEGPKGTLSIVLHRSRKQFILLLSAERSLPRIHLVSQKTNPSRFPGPFTLYLKSRLSGAIVRHVLLLNQDRIVEIAFTARTGEYRLILELTGSSSNLVFADALSNILAVYHEVRSAVDARRTLFPGIQYELPLKKGAQSAAMPGETRNSCLQPKSHELAEANREAALMYERLLEHEEIEGLRSQLRSHLRRSLKKIRRRIEALTADIQTMEKAEQYKLAGDVILANLDSLQPGMVEAELTAHDGTRCIIILDPKHSGTGNAQLYFKKYKKAKAGRKITASRLLQAEDEYKQILDLSEELDQAQDKETLHSLSSRTKQWAQLPAGVKDKKNVSKPGEASVRTIQYSGWEILVGKSAAGNDYLTMKLACDNDLWLHAEGTPGSHVLIRNPGRREIPPLVLVKAASLAAFYSRARAAGKVPVAYTPARHVKKPKGAKPGLVTLSERKTILAVPQAD